MKKLIFIFIFLAAIAAVLFYTHEDPGYVMISYQHWIIATSVWVAVATVLIAFFAIYFLLRTLHFFTSLPSVLRRRKKMARAKKFQAYLSQAVIERLLGNHKKAEKYFVKAANVGDDPASMYLLAAQSANVIHAIERREKYLEMVLLEKPEYQAAVLQIRAPK
jgi:HemY protein